MQRYLFPHRRVRKLAVLILLVSATAISIGSSGCGFVYPPPSIPDLVKKELFNVGDPVALLTFEPGRMGGAIVGVLHDWPFPHVEASEGIPTGNFTYVGHFKVTASSDDDGMPAGAEGTRKVYFHEEQPHLTFADARSYGLGQEVAIDDISMSFTFRENHRIVAVRMLSNQRSARPFAYKGQTIKPPHSRDTTETFEGEYSADYGGYILSTINE